MNIQNFSICTGTSALHTPPHTAAGHIRMRNGQLILQRMGRTSPLQKAPPQRKENKHTVQRQSRAPALSLAGSDEGVGGRLAQLLRAQPVRHVHHVLLHTALHAPPLSCCGPKRTNTDAILSKKSVCVPASSVTPERKATDQRSKEGDRHERMMVCQLLFATGTGAIGWSGKPRENNQGRI